MAKPFKLTEYFTLRDVTPTSLQQDNLVTFSYHSPNGVHDKAPLVIIVEKQLDRVYGFNLHYDMKEMDEVLINTYNKINQFLEREWYRKHPEKKKLLKEKKLVFDKQFIEPKELRDLTRKIPRRDIEQFLIRKKDMSAFRCYLYKRMNKVSKLSWLVEDKRKPFIDIKDDEEDEDNNANKNKKAPIPNKNTKQPVSKVGGKKNTIPPPVKKDTTKKDATK